MTESGDVYDTTITGGRLGMLVFGQQDVIWSRLEARCADRSVEILALLHDKKVVPTKDVECSIAILVANEFLGLPTLVLALAPNATGWP